jgi:serine phosphatase RsbU (regulator of sigma subunit)
VFLNASEADFKSTLQLVTTLQLCVLVFVLNKLTKSKKIITKQKELLEEKQKEITESIQYALRIQTAILPSQKIVQQYLENSFILHKPKNIVAGDFYWMETVNSYCLQLVIVQDTECQGHWFR